MTLPHDGIPRITSHGIDLIKQGLSGNFEGWSTYYSFCNHPLTIPEDDVSNCEIMCAPEWKDDKPQFIVVVWFGEEYPKLKGHAMAPHIEFTKIEDDRERWPDTPSIKLKNDDWYAEVPIAIDDHYVGYANVKTDEDYDEDEQCEIEVKPSQALLDSF